MATLNGRVVLFGGLTIEPGPAQQTVVLGDTWTWDGGAWTEERPPISPPARFAHGTATVR